MRAATPLTTEIKSAPCYYTASFHQRGTFLPKERQNDARQNILYVYTESLNCTSAIVYSFNISQIDSVFLQESEDIKNVLLLLCGYGADLQVKVNPTSTYIRLMPCVD